MRKIIVMAEEGELSLLDKAKEQLGLDLRDAQLIYTGVGAINIIRSLKRDYINVKDTSRNKYGT